MIVRMADDAPNPSIEAGCEIGDEILSVDGQEFYTLQELVALLKANTEANAPHIKLILRRST